MPQLPDAEFAKPKRMLQQPQTLTYLDEVQRKLAALPVPPEIRQAALRQEGLRRRPALWQGDGPQAAALRGVLLACAVVLAKAGAVGQQAVQGVQSIFRNTWRASSLVECINSVLRMQQARHRKMSQGLLDLKRLYWNCHRFRSGRRRGTTPYERLGVPWPPGLGWWDVLKLTPEQLRDSLSALEKPGVRNSPSQGHLLTRPAFRRLRADGRRGGVRVFGACSSIHFPKIRKGLGRQGLSRCDCVPPNDR